MQFRLMTSDEGLSSNNALAVIQADDGRMWISTSEGLDCYDGEKFEHFKARRHGLPSNWNNILTLDSEGLLWVGTTAIAEVKGVYGYANPRISIFDPIQKKGRPFSRYFGHRAPMRESDILAIRKDEERGLWIGTSQGKLYRYYGGRFELMLDNAGAFPITQSLPAREGGFWVLGDHLIVRMDKSGQVLESEPLPFKGGSLKYLADGGIRIGGVNSKSLVQDRMLIKYPGRQAEPFYRLPGGGAFDIRPFRAFHEGPGQTIWCISIRGLEIYDRAGAMISSLGSKYPKVNARYNNAPYFDQSGLAWVVLAEGVALLKLQEMPFRDYLLEEEASIRGIQGLPGGRLLVSSYNGLYILDPGDGSYHVIRQFKSGLGLAFGPDGNVWLGQHSSKVFRYDVRTERLDNAPPVPVEGAGDTLDVIQPFFSSGGKGWLGTSSGLARLDSGGTAFQMCRELNRKYGLADNYVRFFTEVAQGVFIGTDAGLFLFNPDTEKIETVSALSGIDLCHIYPAGPGSYWLATRERGLLYWDAGRDSIRQFGMEEGLPSNVVYAVYPCQRGYLWLSTNAGLCAFHPERGEIYLFGTNSGLPFNEFNFMAHYQAPDGTLYFGGVRGIIAFHPKDIILENDTRVAIRVTSYRQYSRKEGGMVDYTPEFLKDSRIRLRPGEDFFILDFVLQDYLEPEKNRYAYRFGGLNKDWHYINESQLQFGGLPYGSYLLRIKAMGHDGLWAKDELHIPVEVARPLHAQWWFLPGVALLALSFGYGVFRFHLRALREAKRRLREEVARRTAEIESNLQVIAHQKAELETSNQAKDKLFSIIGHELRGPLMFFWNIGARVSYLLKNNKKDELLALGRSAEGVTASLNAMLENLMYWGLIQSGQFYAEKEILAIEEHMKEVLRALEPLARKKRVRLAFEAPPPGLSVEIGRTSLGIVLRNLISNAIKFTPSGGRVRVSARQSDGHVHLMVEDTGIGLTEKQAAAILARQLENSRKGTNGERGAGLGLSITQEILLMNQGSLHIHPGEKGGSVFIAKVPAR